MGKSTILSIAATAVGVALVAGCSGSSSAATPDTKVSSMFTQDIGRWVMPLDDFGLPPTGKSQYAWWLVVRTCMTEQGHDFPLPTTDYKRESQTLNDWDWRLFDEQIAATFGYQGDYGDEPEKSTADGKAADAAAATAPDVFTTCQAEGNAATAAATKDGGVDARTLGASAYEGSQQDPKVLAAAQQWRDCMAPLGIPDLPDRPEGMPSASVSQRFGLAAPQDAPTQARPPAGADQIALAVADAKCRTSSGYTTTLYAAEWDREISLVEENIDALQRSGAAAKALDRKLDEVIAQNGG